MLIDSLQRRDNLSFKKNNHYASFHQKVSFKATFDQIDSAVKRIADSETPNATLESFINSLGKDNDSFRRAHIAFVQKHRDKINDKHRTPEEIKQQRNKIGVTLQDSATYVAVLDKKKAWMQENPGLEVGPCQGKLKNLQLGLNNLRFAEIFFRTLASTNTDIPDKITFRLGNSIDNSDILDLKIDHKGKKVKLGDIEFPIKRYFPDGSYMNGKSTLRKLDNIINQKEQLVSCPEQLEKPEDIRCVCNHNGGTAGSTLASVIIPMLNIDGEFKGHRDRISLIIRPENIQSIAPENL